MAAGVRTTRGRAVRARRAAARTPSRCRGRRSASAPAAAGSSPRTADPLAQIGFAPVTVIAVRIFYVLGGVLAVWAVVLTALGLSSARFPGNIGGQRIVIAISAVLVGLAIGAAVITSKTEKSEQPGINVPGKVRTK